MAEGPCIYDDWLDECVPQLADGSDSDSENDRLFEETDVDDDPSSSEDDEEDGGQMELEEQRLQRKRTNESEMGPKSKKAREPRGPPPAQEVHPPRPHAEEEQSRDKFTRQFNFTGKEEKEGKVRTIGKDSENHFCFFGKPSPCPTRSRLFPLLRRNPIVSMPTSAQMTAPKCQ